MVLFVNACVRGESRTKHLAETLLEMIADNYGMLTSVALDPIEKKPLRRFMPGSLILSVGSYGCNLRCPFCQNYSISWSEEVKYEIVSERPIDFEIINTLCCITVYVKINISQKEKLKAYI
ncbi:pyruvate formate lyase activating enzyme [Oribacterium sp. WCC10]|nr:hypothetical protein [Oribacterium sp. WCC10]SFG70339.1 pyruvate formate lyase activating enzyme [Oribacterium sp. WCC10]